MILLNAECSSLEPEESGFHGDTEAEQRACAKFWTDHIVNVGCTIDGEAVANMGDTERVRRSFRSMRQLHGCLVT